MNTNGTHLSLNRELSSPAVLSTALAFTLFATACLGATETAGTFASPEEAVKALATAVTAHDASALRAVFGSDSENLTNPDRVQATNEWDAFAAVFGQTNRLVTESPTTRTLEIGTNAFPFPVPIVQKEGRWSFDTVAGKEELLKRRIGRNELAVISAARAYVDAQREYASKDRDGDQVLEFAQKLVSTPGTKDGLFWPPDLDGEISPLGPFVAYAQTLGYHAKQEPPDAPRGPYYGYHFRILTAQGKHAPGGKYNYIINGNMIGGFALVAWPAAYGESGIMTFIVNQQGLVYQKDLGPKTEAASKAMKEYNPDPTWSLSPD
jgi:hypothetical protein